MDIAHIILFFIGMLLTAVLVQPLAERLHVPFFALLVVVGFVGSEILVVAGMDMGLRWHHFHDLVIYVFLPILIFESSIHIDTKLLLHNLLPILLLAIPLMLLSAGISAVVLYFGIAHASGFPWIAALLTGALLAATDPVAVIELFKKTGAPQRLIVLIEGESLFNDATAIVLFSILLSIAMTSEQATINWLDGLGSFTLVFFGGIAAGILIGLVTWFLMRLLKTQIPEAACSVVGAFSAFLLAEEWLQVSGVMAVLATGVWIGWAKQQNALANDGDFLFQLWEFNAYIANAMIFLLAGITITMDMFTQQWLAMLLGILAVLIARAIGIYAFVPLLSALPGVETISRSYQTILYWGGVRGAVALALALSLPVSLDYWWTIQSITYGVVLFTLFVQAPTMPPLMRRLKV